MASPKVTPQGLSLRSRYSVVHYGVILSPGARFQVEIEEFLKGCLRFRGQAKAIDIGQLLHDQDPSASETER